MTELTLKDVLDGMADFETRISLLEGLHTPSDASLNSLQETAFPQFLPLDGTGIKEHGRHATIEDLDKLRALFVNLKNQLNEHTDKKESKYTLI